MKEPIVSLNAFLRIIENGSEKSKEICTENYEMVVMTGFKPVSPPRKGDMIGRYTTWPA